MVCPSRLCLEELGARVLPSATPFHLAIPLPAPHVHTASSPALSGTGHGDYATHPTNPDTGTRYHIQGTAQLGNLGHFIVNGNITSVGFIQQGHASGTVTFKNSHGSLTLTLTGPAQSKLAPLPQKFSYTVTSGTGNYANTTGSGTLTLVLKPGAVAGHGHFTLTF